MVAFVNDQMAVIADTIVYDTFPNQALYESTSRPPVNFLRPPPSRPISFAPTPRKLDNLFDPLFEELLTMNQNKCVYSPLRDKPRRDYRFAEGCGCG